MIERYSREEMKKIWDMESKFQYYLDVEIAVCEAYAHVGKFPKSDIAELKAMLKEYDQTYNKKK